MSNLNFKELYETYDQVRISEVLQHLGADGNQDGDSSKWKIIRLERRDNIITKGQTWKNVQTQVHKGHGALSIVAHAMGWDQEDSWKESRKKALEWMIKEFGQDMGEHLKAIEALHKNTPQGFSAPRRYDEIYPEIKTYLTGTRDGERGLPPSLVQEQFEKGILYGTYPYDKDTQRTDFHTHRCVFLGPHGAEVRDTTPAGFKGASAGSDPDQSGFRISAQPSVIEPIYAMVEAAIDALSYAALYPGRSVLSTNGSGRFHLQYKVSVAAIDKGYRVHWAFDKDTAGDLAAQMLFNAFYIRKYLQVKFDLSEDQIDEWFLNEDMYVDVQNTPHEMFWPCESLPPFFTVTQNGVTSEQAPVVKLMVRKDLHPQLLKGPKAFPIHTQAMKKIESEYGLKRERSVTGKDWNDDLLFLGSSYIQAYETWRKSQGPYPDLPPAWHVYRPPQMTLPAFVSQEPPSGFSEKHSLDRPVMIEHKPLIPTGIRRTFGTQRVLQPLSHSPAPGGSITPSPHRPTKIQLGSPSKKNNAP